MTRVDFVFDGAPHYALYEVSSLDGTDEYYLELRDRALISEFGLGITCRTNNEGRLLPEEADTPRKKALLETILLAIDQEAASG